VQTKRLLQQADPRLHPTTRNALNLGFRNSGCEAESLEDSI
jgi:hypothetical protein